MLTWQTSVSIYLYTHTYNIYMLSHSTALSFACGFLFIKASAVSVISSGYFLFQTWSWDDTCRSPHLHKFLPVKFVRVFFLHCLVCFNFRGIWYGRLCEHRSVGGVQCFQYLQDDIDGLMQEIRNPIPLSAGQPWNDTELLSWKPFFLVKPWQLVRLLTRDFKMSCYMTDWLTHLSGALGDSIGWHNDWNWLSDWLSDWLTERPIDWGRGLGYTAIGLIWIVQH